jgi:hypothetical protein
MANTRKPKAQTAGTSRKRQTKAAPAEPVQPDQKEWEALTPDRLRRVWEMQHPGRRGARAAMERLYRRRY